MIISVSLSGCTGNQSEIDDKNSEISELEERIDNLELEITNKQLESWQEGYNEATNNSQYNIQLSYDQGYLDGLDEGSLDSDEALALAYEQGYQDGLSNSDSYTYNDLMNSYDQGFIDGGEYMNNSNSDEDLALAYEQGYIDGILDGVTVSTLDTIMDRGYLICGVKESQYGMGYYNYETGERSGLDISYCKAIASAIGLDSETDIEYVQASGTNRFDLLLDGTIDVLIRTTTWTTSRDTSLDADFGAINFYDGQGILINTDDLPNVTSALQLDGASICVASGSTSAGNIADFFNENNMDYVEVDTWNDGADFRDGYCDAVTGDLSSLVSMKWQFEEEGSVDFEMAIMPEIISKEPLASVTRDHDSEWNEIVSWVWYGMITAEELGITSSNYQNADTSNPAIYRLLNSNLGLGTDSNPLANTWFQNVLEAVGNYGEAYDDAFCDGTYDGYSGSDDMSGCLMSRSGTLNALVSEGGLQYSPPMR